MLIAYTDGSTLLENPGPMSWAVVYVEHDQIVREETGALYAGTNNRAELLAVIWALEHEAGQDLTIRSDSLYTLNIASGLWRAKSNVDLWERFDRALEKRELRGLVTQFEHVKGHHVDAFNKRADALARIAAQLAASCLTETRTEER